MHNTFIKNLREISRKDMAITGGKGASLGELIKIKIPVPAGFVILSSVFDRFLEETDLGVEIEAISHKVDHKNIRSIENASEKIRDLIRDAKFPKNIGNEIFKEFLKLRAKYVAVRSSATAEDSSIASWAGELESYLNVTKENLLESIKKCWSSLFTPRAIFYRYEKGLYKQRISVAVIIQKMIQSHVSGVCFTVHPVTEDKDQMVIEAGYGLGEAIVGGKITPDTYIISKRNWMILDINIGQQKIMIVSSKNGIKKKTILRSKQSEQKLSEKQIINLGKLCCKIEKYYKFPQDIEWAMKNNKFHIVQSRPITTLSL